MKTRRNPLQSQHWTPENHSALTLSQLETEGELPKFIVSGNMNHVFLSTKCCVMRKHWVFLKCYTCETYRSHFLPYTTVGEKDFQLQNPWVWQGSSEFPVQPSAWTRCSESRLPRALPNQFLVSPRTEMLPPFWATCSSAWLWLKFFLILSQNFLCGNLNPLSHILSEIKAGP